MRSPSFLYALILEYIGEKRGDAVDGLLFFPVQCFSVIVVGSVVVSFALGTGIYGRFNSTQIIRAFGAWRCAALVFYFFSFLLFSGIEIEPPVVGGSTRLVLIRLLLLPICQVALSLLLWQVQRLSASKLL